MFYDKTFAQRTLLPILGLLPLLVSLFTFVYDYYSDISLTIEYYKRSSFNEDQQNDTESETNGSLCPDRPNMQCPKTILALQEIYSSNGTCTDYELTPDEYRTAFLSNISFILLPLLIFWSMCAREMLPSVQSWDRMISAKVPKCIYFLTVPILLYPMWLIISFVFAHFFILFVATRQVYYKFRHQRAKRKNMFRRQLQKSEYYWGITRTAEAGLESCGQLILQVWLLSSRFRSLTFVSFWKILDMTYTGVVYFLTFSYKPANEIEKSLGKIFMALLALVIGVSGCYRTLKRGALQISNISFIYVSLFLQVFARIFSLGLYFFAVRSFMPNVPILLAIHFIIVFIIKWMFERARHTKGVLALLVSILNVAASSLVFVRIVPIKKKGQLPGHKCANGSSHPVVQHSTFFVQFLFFTLILFENLLLASVPLFYPLNGTNRAFECLGKEKIELYVGLVFLLCALSWLFHTLYYKCMGHPWSDINGPTFTGGFSFYFHFCGKERLCKLTSAPKETNEPEERCCGCIKKLQISCQEHDECDEVNEAFL